MSTETAVETPKMWVRIYPVNPARGFTKKTFIVHGLPTVFSVDTGWYEVDTAIALQLKKFRNDPENPASPRVFQVCTPEEAAEFDERAKRKVADAKHPVRATSSAVKAIPQPVIFPKETKVETPSASEEDEAPELADEIKDVFDDAFEESEDEGGDFTTKDLDPPKTPEAEKAPDKKRGAIPKPKKH